jgi:putative aminopeptidase FrvX
MDETIQLIKGLTEAHGISGHEGEARTLIQELFTPLGELRRDKTGSVICVKQGSAEAPRVMLAGHMDEIGFMVQHITDEGFLKFVPLGGWWDQVLLGHRVIVKTHQGDVIGVIGAKPPHLLSSDERNKLVEKKDMYIDIGATSKEEVEAAGVRVGDPVVPYASFEMMAPGDRYLSKAFDDRLGVALMVHALRDLQEAAHPNTIYAAATTMEEVGLRGAKTSAEIVNPDVAFILEVDIAGDVPGIKPEEATAKLGKGPSILLLDARMIPNLKLRDFVIDTANELGIALQFTLMTGGATDGGMIHLHSAGVPTIVMGVATRHIHSHNSIIHRQDYDAARRLLVELLQRLDAETVASFTEN